MVVAGGPDVARADHGGDGGDVAPLGRGHRGGRGHEGGSDGRGGDGGLRDGGECRGHVLLLVVAVVVFHAHVALCLLLLTQDRLLDGVAGVVAVRDRRVIQVIAGKVLPNRLTTEMYQSFVFLSLHTTQMLLPVDISIVAN